MMIKEQVKALWKVCFDDSEEFVEMYFRLRYKTEVNVASKITLIRKRSAQGLSDSARSTAAPLSTNPTVLATQANNPAQVTTNIMTAVALTDSKRT